VKKSAYFIAVGLLCLAGCSSSGGKYDKFNGTFSKDHFSDEVMALGPELTEPWRGGKYKVGDPYTINGITYYPEEDFDYSEKGIASWYGPGFHAKMTANGEEFDQDLLTAAHKTLPMPSFARVTNLDNGKKIVVRVNDRGPYAENRIIDLSRASAQALGFKNMGLARVKVEVMSDETRHMADFMKAQQKANRAYARKSNKPAQTQQAMAKEAGIILPQKATVVEREEVLTDAVQPAPSVVEATTLTDSGDPVPGIFIQAGAFSNPDNAHRLKEKLGNLGPVDVVPIASSGGALYRVRLGPMQDEDAARRALDAARDAGVNDARMVMAQTSMMPISSVRD